MAAILYVRIESDLVPEELYRGYMNANLVLLRSLD